MSDNSKAQLDFLGKKYEEKKFALIGKMAIAIVEKMTFPALSIEESAKRLKELILKTKDEEAILLLDKIYRRAREVEDVSSMLVRFLDPPSQKIMDIDLVSVLEEAIFSKMPDLKSREIEVVKKFFVKKSIKLDKKEWHITFREVLDYVSKYNNSEKSKLEITVLEKEDGLEIKFNCLIKNKNFVYKNKNGLSDEFDFSRLFIEEMVLESEGQVNFEKDELGNSAVIIFLPFERIKFKY